MPSRSRSRAGLRPAPLVSVAVLAVIAAAVGCRPFGSEEGDPDSSDRSQGVTTPLPEAPERIRLTSPAFRDGGRIPARFACDGVGASPPLRWSRIPAGAIELALAMEDRPGRRGRLVHWTVYGLSPAIGAIATGGVPAGAQQGRNSFGDSRYGGPCPPHGGGRHRYVIVLYALSERLELPDGARPDRVLRAIDRVAVARGVLAGTYAR